MISKSKAKVLPQNSGRTYWDRASDEIFADLLTANSCTERIALGDACMGRGLLSASISDALALVYFLAETVVAAQVAARRYGRQIMATLCPQAHLPLTGCISLSSHSSKRLGLW